MTPVPEPTKEESRQHHEGPPPTRPEHVEGAHRASPGAAKAKDEVSQASKDQRPSSRDIHEEAFRYTLK